MIKAVIIDLDDTLCQTKKSSFEGDNEVLQRLGYPKVSERVHTKHWGKPADVAAQFWAPGVDIEKFNIVYAEVIKEYVRDGKLDAIVPENLAALDELADMGKALFVLTSRSHHEVEHLLEPDHYLANRIHTFYYFDNTEFHKPDPRTFKIIEQKHGFLPSECVYVGDTIGDAAASLGAGLHFIASLESDLRTKHDFKEAGHKPDCFINAFPEVVKAIRHLDTIAT